MKYLQNYKTFEKKKYKIERLSQEKDLDEIDKELREERENKEVTEIKTDENFIG